MNTLQDGFKIPPALYNEGKKAEYQGVSPYIGGTAQLVIGMSIGQYVMGNASHGSLDIMKTDC